MINMKQPAGIVINCLALTISGVLSFFGALALMLMGTTASASISTLTGIGVTNIAGYLTMGATILIVMAVVSFALAYLLWKRNDIAWWATIFLLGIGVVADVVAIVFFGYAIAPMTFIAIGINVFLILALLHKDVIATVRPDIKYVGWDLD